MSHPPRLSEMTGIRSPEEESEALWPMNLLLFVLGATILGIAFYFLEANDERLLYNPWTYAIATPIALLLLSAVLHSLVSRVIEKSMQLALLLSVLIHLILLVCAVNVVIFSRMWPDVLDTLAQQREQMKRESLQAKQYFHLSSTTQSGQRPDYLRHVATEHQPTESETPVAAVLSLARSRRADLVSPSPKIELARTPHLIERDTPITSSPDASEQSASLSRNDSLVPTKPGSQPPLPLSQQLDDSPPPPLNAASLDLSRNLMQPSPRLQPDLGLPARMESNRPPPLRMPQINRQTTPIPVPINDPSEDLVPRQGDLAVQPPTSPARPLESHGSLTAPLLKPMGMNPPSVSIQARHRSETVTVPGQVPNAFDAMPKTISLGTIANLRRESQPTLATPASNQLAMEAPRPTAGGRIGPAAPRSMPIFGTETLGAPTPSRTEELRAASIAEVKRRTDQRQTTQLPNPGNVLSPSWNGVPSLSDGSTGRLTAAIPPIPDDGVAASADIAALGGSERELARSSLGRVAPPVELTLPSATNIGSDFPQAQEPASAAENTQQASSPQALEALDAVSGLSRTRDEGRKQSVGELLPNDLLPTEISPTPSHGELSNHIHRAGDMQRQLGSEKGFAEALSGIHLPRGHIAERLPSGRKIDIPVDTDQAAPDNSQSLGALLSEDLNVLSRRSAFELPNLARSSLATPLNIEQPVDRGGIAPHLEQSGTLLTRRDMADREWTAPQIESQRFARQDVGGPIAAGQTVAVPKPAFQQRLDRLKDRETQDPSIFEPQTELAIERGLAFLARYQRPDGSWRLQDFDTPVLMRSDTAATGLALLAFQGAGYTHKQFKYSEVVDKAVKFLVRNQSNDGDLYIRQDPASDQNAWLYSHGIASLALCEAYGMTQDVELRTPSQKAISFMVTSQDPRRGGWRYRPGFGADTSVTGWFMMAFKSGQLAGLEVPQATFDTIEQYLIASQASAAEPHLYRYNPFAANTPQQRHGLEPTSVMTSVGLLMRLYFGWQRDKPEMMAGADHLLQHLPENGSASSSRRDTYYWYYATQVMFHMRGERWQRWHDRLYPLLINSQILAGEFEGSWHPNYPTPDLWARYGGRLYVTTMNLLSLEVSYRHLPLYEATAQ